MTMVQTRIINRPGHPETLTSPNVPSLKTVAVLNLHLQTAKDAEDHLMTIDADVIRQMTPTVLEATEAGWTRGVRLPQDDFKAQCEVQGTSLQRPKNVPGREV
jgi:hypothetical protein